MALPLYFAHPYFWSNFVNAVAFVIKPFHFASVDEFDHPLTPLAAFLICELTLNVSVWSMRALIFPSWATCVLQKFSENVLKSSVYAGIWFVFQFDSTRQRKESNHLPSSKPKGSFFWIFLRTYFISSSLAACSTADANAAEMSDSVSLA